MKKLFLILALVVATVMSVRAEYTSDGFYRVHNYDTNRYIYVYDNTGSINLTGTTVDLYAIQLWMGRDRAISDPASVLYVEKHGNKFDIKTQGTGIQQMIDAYVTLRADTKVPGTYWAYGSSNGMTKYLCDGNGNLAKEQSWLVGEGTARRNWYVTPIDAASDNYFGVNPTVNADGADWAALYADFSFAFASEGMEAYYVKSIDAKRGLAIWSKINSDWVFNATPVIIKCADYYKGANRLHLEMKKGVKPEPNMLTGVYFNYNDVASHTNRVRFDKKTMRVLGITKDGHIGMIADDIDYVPRNSVYLTVPAGSPSDFRLVTQAEYDNIVANERPEPQQVTLDKSDIALYVGESESITATVLPADATTTKVTWSTSNQNVVTVDANGHINAVGVGQATVTAKCANVSATCRVTVNPILVESITLSPESMTLLVGENSYINASVAPQNATDKTVTWSSSDPQVATVAADGKVQALKVGVAVITAACGNVKATCQVTVKDIEVEEITLSEYELSIKPDMTAYLYAYVKPDNAKDKTVVWTSSDPEVATVSTYGGTVKSLKPGVTDVTATCGKVSATCRVTVIHNEPTSVTITPKRSQVEIGSVLTVQATVRPSNTTRQLEWSSSDESILTVTDNGDGTATVTTVGVGEAEAVATCGSITASCKVTVNHIEPKKLTIDPQKAEVEVDSVFSVQVVVSPENTTRQLEWTCSDEAIIKVADNGDGTATVTAIGAGEADAVATCGAISIKCHVKVKEVVGITDIEVDSTASYDVYDLQGVMVRRAGASLEGLPHGVYIINGQKYLLN